MKIDVINTQGQSTGRSVELPENVFGVEPNNHAVYLAVKSYQAAQRQGTHKSKEKGEVNKSTKKIKKQKGTGTARAGSLKSPLFKGGGRVFGPKPHKYSVGVNKKVNQLARYSALSAKASEGLIKVIEDFSYEAPKTKDFQSVLNNLELAGKKSIFVSGNPDKNVYLSSKNIQKVGVISVDTMNIFDILSANTIVLTESAIEKMKSATS